MHSFYLAPEHLDLITVDGPDAAKFLQGQLTCDVEALSGQNLVHGAACNNKGRVIATFVMLRHDEVYCLIFSKGLGDLFAAALKKYMPFYKCRLQLAPPQWQCMGIVGKAGEAQLAMQLANPLPAAGAVSALADGWVSQLDDQFSRYLLCSNSRSIDETMTAMGQDMQAGDVQRWQLANMLAGHFPLAPEDSEKYTPQELNLETRGYISFSKGCYTGQEIVARMHYRGKVKKQLYLLVSSTYTSAMLTDGFDVCTKDGNVIGHTVKQLPAEDDGLASLALLSSELAQQPDGLFDSRGESLDVRPF